MPIAKTRLTKTITTNQLETNTWPISKIRVLLFWTQGSDHVNDLYKILLQECNIKINTDNHLTLDKSRKNNILIYLEKIKHSRSNCLTTYYYNCENNGQQYFKIKLYLIRWSDPFEPKSDFFQCQFAEKYFPLTNFAVGFYYNSESFQHACSWLKAFYRFNFHQKHQIRLYLISLTNKQLNKQIFDFIKEYQVRFIHNSLMTKASSNSSVLSSIFTATEKYPLLNNPYNPLAYLFQHIVKTAIKNEYWQNSNRLDIDSFVQNQLPNSKNKSKSKSFFVWMLSIEEGNTFIYQLKRYFKMKIKIWWNKIF